MENTNTEIKSETLPTMLRESVFYPCCYTDGAPIKHLDTHFSCFIYADYAVERNKIETIVNRPGLSGYTLDSTVEIPAETLFGVDWYTFMQQNRDCLRKVRDEWKAPYALHFHFVRKAGAPKLCKPAIDFIYIKAEAIAAYRGLYHRLGIAPACVTYIQPGAGLGGGNYGDFPAHFDRALRMEAGPPRYLLLDEVTAYGGAYMPLIAEYNLLAHWRYRPEGFDSGYLYFGEYVKDQPVARRTDSVELHGENNGLSGKFCNHRLPEGF
ncbi:hypothetical protein AGMMS49944_19000 [Spirochaetia bacterium]|nr:hypothetical protein AGMMS49944_19000 [Spirochaetia bacterium]